MSIFVGVCVLVDTAHVAIIAESYFELRYTIAITNENII